MTLPLLVCLLATATAPALPETQPCRNGYCADSGAGQGTSYYKNRMEGALAVNLARGLLTYRHLPAVALGNCGTIGRTLWARVQTAAGWSPWIHAQQVDCVRPGHDWSVLTHNGRQAWIEWGYQSAVRLGLVGVGRFPVQVALRGTP